MHVIAAKAVSFKEAMSDDFKTYQQQVVRNERRSSYETEPLDRAVLQGEMAGLASSVFRETEGNPFFVHEVVRLLARDGRLDGGGSSDSWSFSIPQGVREVIGQAGGEVRVASTPGRGTVVEIELPAFSGPPR